MGKQRQPNVVLCAIGFAAAGTGVGSLVGTIIGAQVEKEVPGAADLRVSGVPLVYLWLFRGVWARALAGGLLGMWYALIRRLLPPNERG